MPSSLPTPESFREYTVENAGRWLRPPLLLALALSSVFLAGIDKTHFNHAAKLGSAETLSITANLSLEHRLRLCLRLELAPDGSAQCLTHSRWPVGIYALVKLAMWPFDGDLLAMMAAVRTFMLLLLCVAAALAYLALRRVASDSWVALAATLIAFSSYNVLHYGHAANTEGASELFAMMLVFHGMVIYVQDRRFGQLVAKTCVALLLGWRVYALLLPFVVLGLVSESVCIGRQMVASRCKRPAQVALSLIRSRFVVLGAVALLFGTAVLSFNLANEYAAHDGELSLTELPTLASMRNRTGFWKREIKRKGNLPFPLQQLHRVGTAVVPFALPAPRDGFGRLADDGWIGVSMIYLGTFALVACIVWLPPAAIARREKMLLATLALFGPCWALGMWRNTYLHPHESMFWFGVPLAVYALILLRYRQRLNGRLAMWAAIVTVPVFALSPLKEGRLSHSDELQKTMMADFSAIRETTRGKTVFIDRDVYSSPSWQVASAGFFLPGSILQFDTHAPMKGGGILYDGFKNRKRGYDFIVSTRRLEHPALLTPDNQRVFLYDGSAFTSADGFFMDSYRAELAALAPPETHGDFEVYLQDRKLIYFNTRCMAENKRGIFFLHVVPEQVDDLPKYRASAGFDNLDFSFVDRGVAVDGKCLMNVQLPPYAIASAATGQYLPDEAGEEGVLWRMELDLAMDAIEQNMDAIEQK